MQQNDDKPPIKDKEMKIIDVSDIKIPQCCREGWDNCKHVINKPKDKRKVNIGL